MRLPNSHPTWRLDEQGNWQRADYERPPVVVPPEGVVGTQRGFADWRRRLNANLSRSSDSRWDPLTYDAGAPRAAAEAKPERTDADPTGRG